jgi:broad specificity phosphatase PhoE
MDLVLIRHGETEWTLNGRHTGTTDLELTPHGRDEAKRLAPVVAHLLGPVKGEAVVCSPRLRAQQTAEEALPTRELTIDPRLAEFNYGDYEGLTKTEILALHPGWDLWRYGCPNGETVADAGRRADSLLADYAGKARMITVSHGHMSRILAARALGLAPEMGRLLAIDTASLSILRGVGEKPVIALWNAVG